MTDPRPTYEITFQYEVATSDFPEERVRAAIIDLLTRHDVEEGTTLSFVLMDDEQVRAFNLQYRGIDQPTDILSFPADPLREEEREAMAENGDGPYLGDLLVAYPYTVRQADESGHPLDDELVLLAIHGTLHLLGYDHDNTDNQAKMWAAQSEALKRAGITIEVPLFTFGDDRAT